MRKRKLWSLVILCLLVFGCPMSVLAGTFEETSSGWHYRKDDGNYARSEWVLDQGAYYYLDQNGIMMADTTTPDGYLVGGGWKLGDGETGYGRVCEDALR